MGLFARDPVLPCAQRVYLTVFAFEGTVFNDLKVSTLISCVVAKEQAMLVGSMQHRLM
jgi:hypothetical protein